MRTGRCAGAAFCEKGGIVCARFVRFSGFSDNLLKKSGKTLDFSDNLWYTITVIKMYADLAHLVERNLAKVEVAGSSPVIRLKTAAENAPSFCFLCVPSSANRAADSFPSDDRRHTRLTGGYLKKTNPRETRFS